MGLNGRDSLHQVNDVSVKKVYQRSEQRALRSWQTVIAGLTRAL